MTDLLAIAIWPIATGACALLFSIFMYWRITKEHPTRSADKVAPPHTMAE
jgi:hypothetical protein